MQGTDTRGQKQCQGFLWLFFRSVPLDYKGKCRFLGHTVSRNSAHTAVGLVTTPSCPKPCVTVQLRELCSAEQPENRHSVGRKCVSINTLFHTAWSLPLNDDRNKSPSLDSPGSTVSDLPWSRRQFSQPSSLHPHQTFLFSILLPCCK